MTENASKYDMFLDLWGQTKTQHFIAKGARPEQVTQCFF
jgi:hypothetical protein